jgi:hypothetical protein
MGSSKNALNIVKLTVLNKSTLFTILILIFDFLVTLWRELDGPFFLTMFLEPPVFSFTLSFQKSSHSLFTTPHLNGRSLDCSGGLTQSMPYLGNRYPLLHPNRAPNPPHIAPNTRLLFRHSNMTLVPRTYSHSAPTSPIFVHLSITLWDSTSSQ